MSKCSSKCPKLKAQVSLSVDQAFHSHAIQPINLQTYIKKRETEQSPHCVWIFLIYKPPIISDENCTFLVMV